MSGCEDCHAQNLDILSHHAFIEPEEPPLTPEEEEELSCANESGCYRQHTNDCEFGCRYAADELTRLDQELEEDDPPAPCKGCGRSWHKRHECPPHQPERRPAYAVAYSVSGHLYEVALSGDASVRAVDGALVIQHHLGPVSGIVQVLPVINEEQPSV